MREVNCQRLMEGGLVAEMWPCSVTRASRHVVEEVPQGAVSIFDGDVS